MNGLRLRSIFYYTLDMRGHENRTAKDAKEEIRGSDRHLKLELMGDR